MNDQPKLPALPALKAGAQLQAINPTTFDEVKRLAKLAVLAGLSASPDNDEDKAIAKATMAILQGLEIGVPAIQAVQGIAIINGKPMIYGDLLTAVLWSKGFKVEKRVEGAGDIRCGYAKVTRPDGTVIEKRFSVADARKARLWDERTTVKRKNRNGEWYDAPNDAPWYRFPDRMLEWRAFGFACKDGASDVTRGMYVREEMAPEYNDMVDITPAADPRPALPTVDQLFDDGGEAAPAPEAPSDEQFLAAFRAAAETHRGDQIALGHLWDAHADEIAARGLEQACSDMLHGTSEDEERPAETVSAAAQEPETVDDIFDAPAVDPAVERKLAAFEKQLAMAPNLARMKECVRSWEPYVGGLPAVTQAKFQAAHAAATARLKARAAV